MKKLLSDIFPIFFTSTHIHTITLNGRLWYTAKSVAECRNINSNAEE